MIVRISGEDQYRLDDAEREQLERLEGGLVGVIEGGSEDGYSDSLAAMLDFVRSHGERIADDEIVTSDYILPPADASFEEARAEFTGEGLIPD